MTFSTTHNEDRFVQAAETVAESLASIARSMHQVPQDDGIDLASGEQAAALRELRARLHDPEVAEYIEALYVSNPTLGDIATVLQSFRAKGVTAESVRYVVSRVWPGSGVL